MAAIRCRNLKSIEVVVVPKPAIIRGTDKWVVIGTFSREDSLAFIAQHRGTQNPEPEARKVEIYQRSQVLLS